MSNELTILIGLPFAIIPTFLVILNYLNKNEKKEAIVIDYMEYVKSKEKGDVVDRSIAQLLDIERIAA